MFSLNGAVKYKYIPNYQDMRGGYDKLTGELQARRRKMHGKNNEKMRMPKSTIFNRLRHGTEFLENCQGTIKQWLFVLASREYKDSLA